MNILKSISAKFISRLSVNVLRVGLLLPVVFFSPVSQAAEPVCAVVKIELSQELTLERQAFDAVMRINNGLDILSLENVNINVTFKDETGAAVLATSDTTDLTARFYISAPSLSGIDTINNGTIAPKTTAEIHWLIIPAAGSGGSAPSGQLYFVGATLTYNLGGEAQTTVISPDSIYVKPLPLLTLDYFLEKEVFADDLFTPGVKEPAIPFTLGVRVKNIGEASATGLKIDSAQPTITENEQGLLVGFNIIGSSVNERSLTNSLLVDFGEIKPNEASMGRWDMVTTLSGEFTSFTAEFLHADDLGGQLTSIIDTAGIITTHTLIRNVLVDVNGRDLVRDFLALDANVYRVYESSGVDTDVHDSSLGATLTPVNTGDEVSLTLTASVTPGFNYVKIRDLYNGTKVVKQLYRSDGKNLPLDNAWTSKTRKYVTGENPTWEYWVNVFDANISASSPETYTLLMGVPVIGPVAPVFTPLNNVTTYETATVTFPVAVTDANGDAVTLISSTLPTGATFTSDTSGSGTFTWIPSVGQAGNYTITFTASDGTLTTTTTITIKVNPVWDTDGDGLDDAWEILHFGDLSRDGTGDLDGDGISDLQEYLDQTDPTLVPPLVPTNLVALPGNAENTLSWDTVTGVDSYHVYWSLTADVSPTTVTVLTASTSPFVHTGLENDVTYYYVVTSVGTGGESAASNVVSVTTGVRDWSAPVTLQNNTGAAFVPHNVHIAMSATGDAIAVWQQTNTGLNSIWSSRYVSATGWTPPVLVSDITVDSSAVQIATDSDGNALAVWQQINPVQTDIMAARFDSVTGGWATAVAIETDDTSAALSPRIAMSKSGSNNGNALVVWQQGAHIMSAGFVGQAWQTAAVVSAETVTDLSQLTLSMNENGDAFVAWVSSADQTNYDLRVNKFSSSAWATTVVTLATGLDNEVHPALDINASGAAVMAWSAFNGTRHIMMASQYDVSIGWGVADALETILMATSASDARSARVAMDTNGNAFVTWAQSGSPYSIYVNRLDVDTGFAGAVLLEQRQRGDAANPQLAIDNRGNAIVSWQQSDGVQHNILAAVYNNTDSAWSAEGVIETTNSGDAVAPAMAVSDSGNAIVVWQQNNNGALTIAANHYAVGNNGIPNIPPIAIAGADQTVNEQTTVTLDGSASFDQDGSGLISTYSWTQTSGTLLTLTGATTATPSFIAPIVLAPAGSQVFIFELSVTDDANATSTQTVSVTVDPVNAAPVANAGADKTVNEKTAVSLSALPGSSDSDGTIASYQWSQVLQTGQTPVTLTTANTATASFESPTVLVQDGDQVLTFTVLVTDNEGATHSDTMTVTVQAVNADPVANAGVDQSVNEQTAVSLSALLNSSDSDGTIVSYQWTQVLGVGEIALPLTDANTATASFTSPIVLIQDGDQVLTFTVLVTDNEGATHSDTMTVTVQAVNANPVANAGVDQSVNEQTAVSLSALPDSSDSDGTIASYQWTQVLGVGEIALPLTNANTATASFTSPIVLIQDGDQVLTFTVLVTDNEGATHSDTMTVTVQAVNLAPVANAGINRREAEYTLVSLAGTGTDSDGTITAYQWTQTSGLAVTLSGATTATATFVAPPVYQDEVLSFNLVVTDNETGVSPAGSVSITLYSVNPDDDADGLPDVYEIAHFGNLTRDGTADADNDGYSDLQEYQDGTNPLALTLAAPTGLKAVAANAQVTLSWTAVDTAASYTVYWDTTPNVTKTSHVITNVNSGYVHTGLTNGTSYYYVVTTLSAGDESVVSNEVSARPNQRAWHTASAVDSGTTTYFYPHIAMNRTGQSVVVYEQYDGIAYSAWATIYNTETGWGVAQAIETGNSGNVYNPQVAMDDAGNAIAVWEQFNGSSYNVWAAVYDAQNASWGVAEQIETSLTGGAEYFMPQVSMSQQGLATVVWQKHDGLTVSIWASRYEKGIGWAQAVKLEGNDLHSAYLPQVAVNSAGHAAVAWEQWDAASGRYHIWNASYNLVTGWSAATIISNASNLNAYDAQISLADNGQAVAVWEQFDGTRYNVWSNVAQGGVWSTAQRVEFNTTGTNEYFYPHVAQDKNATAMVVWQQYDGNHVSAWANRLVNGVWETAARIEANDLSRISSPRVAMDEEGNAVAVWEQFDDGSNNSVLSIWENRYSNGSGWASAQPLETTDNETMWNPEVAMDAYGNAKAVWFHNGSTGHNILVAENILHTNPPVANAGIDQGGFVAQDIVSLDATGSFDVDGTIVSYHWHQLSGVEVSLTGKETAMATFAAPRSQSTLVLTFIVTVTDNAGLSASDTVVITIGDATIAALSGVLSTTRTTTADVVNPTEQFTVQELDLLTETTESKGKSKFPDRLRSHAIERQSLDADVLDSESTQISTAVNGEGGRGRSVK